MSRITLVSFVLAGVFACATAVTTSLWRGAVSERDAAASRSAALQAENTRLRSTNGPAPAAQPPPGENQAEQGKAGAPNVKDVSVEARLLQAQKTISYLESRLAEARRDLNASHQEIAQKDVRAQSEAGNAQKLNSEVASLRDEVEAAKRNSASLEMELRSRTDALTKAEAAYKAANDRLAKVAADAAAATRQTTTASREIDDLSRRRENYMTSLQRRFREVTDLYRGFALDQQNRGAGVVGNASNPPMMQAGDLSRIQNAIAQAEDDLRQVQSLNARIATLMKGK